MLLIKYTLPLLLIFFHSLAYSELNLGTLSIVIDDLGYSHHDFEALKLPKEIAFSLLPFTPNGKELAKLAHQQGRDILVHVPMEAKSNNNKLGKGALMSTMNEQQLKTTLRQSLQYFPQAQGINNHMGSKLSEQTQPMRWVMEVLLAQGLYFIDSRTTANTVAETMAKKIGVVALRRNVFLDNIKTTAAMDKQFQHAIQLSQTQTKVVIIAHPYPETLDFLSEKLNRNSKNYDLIALNKLIYQTQQLVMQQKSADHSADRHNH